MPVIFIAFLISFFALFSVLPTVSGFQWSMGIVQAQDNQKTNVWFYSDADMEYWITSAKKQNDNTYSVHVSQTCNGKRGTFHIYDVKYEEGLTYASCYSRISGSWGEWCHSDFSDAMWSACVEYF